MPREDQRVTTAPDGLARLQPWFALRGRLLLVLAAFCVTAAVIVFTGMLPLAAAFFIACIWNLPLRLRIRAGLIASIAVLYAGLIALQGSTQAPRSGGLGAVLADVLLG